MTMICRIEKIQLEKTEHKDILIIPYRDYYILVNIKEIIYLQADRQYTKIVTDKKSYVLSRNLKWITEKLPDYFLRIHHSFHVNLMHGSSITRESTFLLKNNLELPISRRRKKDVIQRYTE